MNHLLLQRAQRTERPAAPIEAAVLPQMGYAVFAAPLHALGVPDAPNVVSWLLSLSMVGLGWSLLRRAGLKVVIVTGRESESVRLRALELNVDALSQDRHARKLPNLEKVLAAVGGTLETTAFIGDDIPDVPILRKVGMPVCVGNATGEARQAAQVHLTRHGGRGAVLSERR